MYSREKEKNLLKAVLPKPVKSRRNMEARKSKNRREIDKKKNKNGEMEK